MTLFIPQQSENPSPSLCKISKIFSSSFSFSSTLQATTKTTTQSWLTCQGKGVKCACITQIRNHRLQNDLRVSSNRWSYHISSLCVCICQKNRLSQGWNEVSAARHFRQLSERESPDPLALTINPKQATRSALVS